MNDRILWLSIAGALIAAICLGCSSTTLYGPDGKPVAKQKLVGWPPPDQRVTKGRFTLETGKDAWNTGGVLGGKTLDVLSAAIPLAAQYAMSRPSPVSLPAASQPAK